MMQRRRAEAVMRLGLGKSKPGRIKGFPSRRNLSNLCTKLARSKVVSLAANFCGAVGCILANKLVFRRGFDLPLTMTFFGYSLVSLCIVISALLRRGFCRSSAMRYDSEDDIETQHSLVRANGHSTMALSSRQAIFRRILLIFFTALAPALANASLRLNSVGFTQLSKVLTTPCIAALERSRGIGAPLTPRRLFWLAVVHIGVLLASVSDATMTQYGAFVALLNVIVTARYKVEWSATCREQVRLHTHGAAEKPTPAIEFKALREVVELTLPQATLCLLPLALAIEGRRALESARDMDSTGLCIVAIAAALGALTSLTGYTVIGRLSALTHQILGQFKMCCLIFASRFLFAANLNTTQFVGAGVTMYSIVAYTRATLDQRRQLDELGRHRAKGETKSIGENSLDDSSPLPRSIRSASSRFSIWSNQQKSDKGKTTFVA